MPHKKTNKYYRVWNVFFLFSLRSNSLEFKEKYLKEKINNEEEEEARAIMTSDCELTLVKKEEKKVKN